MTNTILAANKAYARQEDEKRKKVLAEIVDEGNWSLERLTCRGCGALAFEMRCRTSRGRLCTGCAMEALRTSSAGETPSLWEAERTLDALSPGGDLADRVVIFEFIEEAARQVAEENSEGLEDFYFNLVGGLGFSTLPALGPDLRTLAFEAVTRLGTEMMPHLLSHPPDGMWQHRVNIALAAVSIAPHVDAAQAYLIDTILGAGEEALGHLSKRLPDFRDSHTRQTLETLTASDSQEISLFAGNALGKNVDSAKAGATGQKGGRAGGKGAGASNRHSPPTPLSEMIDHAYSKEVLERLYGHCLYHFEKNGKKRPHKKKAGYVRAMKRALASRKAFGRLLALLPAEMFGVLMKLTWEGGEIEAKACEKTFGGKILLPGGGKTDPIHEVAVSDPYLLFDLTVDLDFELEYDPDNPAANFIYHLSLISEMRTLFKTYLPKPAGYDLSPAQRRATAFEKVTGERTLEEMALACGFVAEKNVHFTKAGKVAAASLKRMAKECRIEEFYAEGDRSLLSLKTQMIASVLTQSNPAIKILSGKRGLRPGATPEFQREIASAVLKNPGLDLNALLPHLKGLGNLGDYGHEGSLEKRVFSDIRKILTALPEGKWMDVSDILRYALYRDLNLGIIDREVADEHLYVRIEYQGKSFGARGYDKHYLHDDRNYDVAVTKPFLKAVFYLVSCFGMVDIAYNLPENEHLQDNGKNWLTPYDGLAYVRLTDLGAFILGKRKQYKIKHASKPAGVIHLDDQKLLVTLEGEDRMKQILLDRVGQRVGPGSYKISYASFMQGAESRSEVRERIKSFRELIGKKAPRIFREFLTSVGKRVDPLTFVHDRVVFKLGEHPELISLFAKDPVLKGLVLKAENYHILVDTKELSKLRKRLNALGFLMDLTF